MKRQIKLKNKIDKIILSRDTHLGDETMAKYKNQNNGYYCRGMQL